MVPVVVLLDLGAACGTVDPRTLLQRLMGNMNQPVSVWDMPSGLKGQILFYKVGLVIEVHNGSAL